MNVILSAFLAAVFYAINIPASKVLLRDVGPTTMAALHVARVDALHHCVRVPGDGEDLVRLRDGFAGEAAEDYLAFIRG